MAHLRLGRIGLTARTVLVRGSRVEGAYFDLTRVLKNSGIEAQVSTYECLTDINFLARLHWLKYLVKLE